MVIFNDNGTLSSGWFRKATDTGLTLNFHSIAPSKYKKSVIISFVYRIFRACSSWQQFDIGLNEAMTILRDNQYPDSFFYPIIHATLNKLITVNNEDVDNSSVNNLDLTLDPNACLISMDKKDKFKFFLEYRGKPTDLLAKSFHKLNAPCTVIMTTRKLKTCLPSLKPLVPKMLRSNVVYKLTCPSCNASYVGQTVRHVQQRVREHLGSKGIMKSHFDACGVDPLSIQDFDFVSLLDKANKTSKLLTLEALYISKIKPVLNTKDEFKSRTLTLKLY